MYRKFFKRFLDIVISFSVLLCLSPLLLLLSVWLHFANHGAGAFFLQERPGKGGKVFKVIKFKTHAMLQENYYPTKNELHVLVLSYGLLPWMN